MADLGRGIGLVSATDVGAVEPSRECVAALVVPHLDFVGRLLRHLGTPEADVEDLMQTALSVAVERLDDIRPGCERAFLAQTAVRLAAGTRRARARTREVPTDDLPEVADGRPTPDELWEKRQGFAALHTILDDMAAELRAVFVLFEIEEMTTVEIAGVLQIPQGTVASRLRRGREVFLGRVRALHAGGRP